MANIPVRSSAKVFTIDDFLGINESADGDSGLKLGEAAEMRNFRITMEKNLQIRPGSRTMLNLVRQKAVRGLWCGYVKGSETLLSACGGHVWKISYTVGENGVKQWSSEDLGRLTDADTQFFGFENEVFILNGVEYKRWSGEGDIEDVVGYVPIVATATPPEGGGTTLEQINRLSSFRRQQFSADGTAKEFVLAEQNIHEVTKVTIDGEATTAYTADTAAGKVTFNEIPDKGVNNVEITWDKGEDTASEVLGMRFAETYNGTTDSRVFLYGDGTNRTIFTGLDENGRPRADYFPAMDEISIDAENTPITGMVKHYDRLIVYKLDGTWAISYGGGSQGSDGAAIVSFSVIPINREIGNQATGQVRLVYNNPRSITSASVYEWKLYSGSVRDERNASRISDRVYPELKKMDLSRAITFDDERNYEFWVLCDDTAVIHNYAIDVWYKYDSIPATCFVMFEEEVYFGTKDGRFVHFSRDYRSDDTADISTYWESGSMSFDIDFKRKYSTLLFVTLKPESNARLMVTAESNRKSDYPDKLLSSNLATFAHVDFAHWSFSTNRKPNPIRVKLKVKKFAFYKLIFYSESASATATVMSVSMLVRYTGYIK